MALVSIRNIPRNYLVCSNDCTVKRSLRARASGWQMSSASFINTAAGHGRKAWWTTAQRFTFHSQSNTNLPMDSHFLTIKSILLVEDDPDDVELTLSALEDNHLANRV